jgi:SAM-dependent methyltransferase
MIMSQVYSKEFFEGQQLGSKRSSERIVPVLRDLFRPSSVLDVGCGVGHWLATFKELGVQTVTGVDGPWVSPDQLHIARGEFIEFDFTRQAVPERATLPTRHYDLAMSLEFLEHVESRFSRDIVGFLCRSADVVVASAAVPGQGGSNHVNEQWPNFWNGLFAENGYVACDLLRPMIWDMNEVEPWYAQNMIVYFKDRIPEKFLDIAKREAAEGVSAPRALVHPGLLSIRNDPTVYPASQLMVALVNKAMKRIGSIFRS